MFNGCGKTLPSVTRYGQYIILSTYTAMRCFTAYGTIIITYNIELLINLYSIKLIKVKRERSAI